MENYVFYEDTDCGGIVFHANYFKFCERARSLIFFKKNYLPENDREGFVVVDIHSKFFIPLEFGDIYRVDTTLVEIRKSSATLKQEVKKIGKVGSEDRIEVLSFQADLKLAYIDYIAKKPKKIPEFLLSIVENI